MKQTQEDSKLIQIATIIGDFIILNFTLIAIFYIFKTHAPEVLKGISLRTYIAIANLCYIPSINIFKVVLHNRIVRPEIIVNRIVYTLCTHLVLSITVIAIMKLPGLSRSFFFSFYIVFFLLICIWRLSFRYWVKRYRKRGKNLRTVVFVGSETSELYQTLTEANEYKIIGVFSDTPLDDSFPTTARLLGKVENVISWLEKNNVNELFCSLSSNRSDEILQIINYCENNLMRFYSVPNVRRYLKRTMKMELFADIPVLYIRDEPLLKAENRFMKRSFDLLCSTAFLCSIYPIMYIIIGSIIKITSPGPIYFRQERSGENGKIFKCIKFRSMKVNKDCDSKQATENDPRKTKFGNFLRKSNLDEFPQVINVWKGDMSLIGPRPHMLKHTEMYSNLINKYMVRHLVKPGISGWAQVTGYRGETKELSQMEGRVKRDIWYIENWSFLLDLRIIYKTVKNIIVGDKNAY